MFLDIREMQVIWNEDPTIVVVHNPRIRRWIVAQDLSKLRTPKLVGADPALIGVPGVRPDKTNLKYLFKVEVPYMGMTIPIKATGAWVVEKLRQKTVKALPDLSDYKAIEDSEVAAEAVRDKHAKEWAKNEGDYALSLAVRRNYHYDGMTNHTGRLQ